MIGMNDAYEQARALEEAAENGDAVYINANHASFLGLVADRIKNIIA